LGSGFAPASQSTIGPWKAGIVTAMPGRCTPGSRFMFMIPAATHAPVLPAEITTSTGFSALLDPSRLIFTIDDSVRCRTARVGDSSISIMSGACTIDSRGSLTPRSARCSRISGSGPMRMSSSSSWRTSSASMLPLRTASGA